MNRFPEQFPAGIAKGEFNQRTGAALEVWARSIIAAVAGMQGTPGNPSEVQAGVSADPNPDDSQAAAASSHIHSIDTAAPGRVLFGGTPAEGAGTALLRADATLVLEDGSYDGDFLVWDAAAGSWVSTSGADALAASNAYAESVEVLYEILTLLRSINYMIREGLTVPDQVETIRGDMGSDTPIVAELRTLSQLLMIGLNVPQVPQ